MGSADGFFWDVLRFDDSVEPVEIEPINTMRNDRMNPIEHAEEDFCSLE